jgi:mono/diheme cytochrome c family protein
MRFAKYFLLFLIGAVVIATAAFVRFGMYDVAADTPHWRATHAALAALRDRSVAARASSVEVPDLSDAAMIREGAGNYDSMCVGCHLRPGLDETELSLGLYPAPPSWRDLGRTDPREAFWVIKHGIKMTGMPAWGKSMDDRYIWGMVAFIGRFPDLDAAQYVAMVELSPGHSHGGGESDIESGDATAPDESARSSFEPIDDPMASGADVPEHDSHPDHPH